MFKVIYTLSGDSYERISTIAAKSEVDALVKFYADFSAADIFSGICVKGVYRY